MVVESNYTPLRSGFTGRLSVPLTETTVETKRAPEPVWALTLYELLEEREGFEPSEPCGPAVFETAALNQTLPPLLLKRERRVLPSPRRVTWSYTNFGIA